MRLQVPVLKLDNCSIKKGEVFMETPMKILEFAERDRWVPFLVLRHWPSWDAAEVEYVGK